MTKCVPIIELPPKGERFKNYKERYPIREDYQKAEKVFLENYKNILVYFKRVCIIDNVDFDELSKKLEKIVICALYGYCNINWIAIKSIIIDNREVKNKAVTFKILVDRYYDVLKNTQ